MDFEWDEEKEQKNIIKHGIDFSTAALVFGDDDRIEFYDEEHSLYEDRYITIGLVDDVLTVVYTMRTDTYRIISARLATRAEQEEYYGN
ncbi:BrnT family toxin [Butyrivibrio sp. INlla16]|uniref:BrnT family toxin n=1 Tax=Butyrivibrio sp. INlla16 TaxID=1520807 RepID=UPI000885C461|nr:BrnT family toxin [Butyrivibrio sp. INlla16]SDB12733.1 hypothetical protein SAMN02910263_00574 [Butyrivibrio sp. INlla16]SDB49721.1 hypothetical protein SAMN02910263_02463 [Butyrivibrio sp. INlla16]